MPGSQDILKIVRFFSVFLVTNHAAIACYYAQQCLSKPVKVDLFAIFIRQYISVFLFNQPSFQLALLGITQEDL